MSVRTLWVLCLLFGEGICLGVCPSADLSGNCRVALEDVAILSAAWLSDDTPTANWNPTCDISSPADGVINELDLYVLAVQWLEEGISEDPNIIIWVTINDPGVSGHEAFHGQMSKYETTNAQYCLFLNAALASGDVVIDGSYVVGADGANGGADFVDEVYYRLDGPGFTYDGATYGGAARIYYDGYSFTIDSGFESHPVSYVSWYGATAFCNYYDYRLPTEWEWQAVADYNGSYTYGCGTSINNSIANYLNSTHPDGTAAYGTFGDPAGYGYRMCDMAGNVWEWTSSCYYGGCDPGYRVIRGGGWFNIAGNCTVSYRHGGMPYDTDYHIGFRVCR